MKSSSNFNGWKITQLGNICDISSSKRIFASEYKTSGIPFYRGKEIIEKFNKKPISTELFISPERFNEINNKFGVPKEGDILLTSVGTLGIPYLVGNEDFYFKDGNLTWFKQFKSCNSRFLFFWFQSPIAKHQIETKSIGSTQKALTIDILKSFTIHLPPIKVQNKIVAILSSIDDKIELNNKINRNLEAQAQAIFKSWFIDFEPFKNGKFIDSELGKIPEGWSVSKLTNSLNIKYGKNLPQSKLTKTGYPVYGANGQIGFFPQIMYKKPQVLISCRGAASGKVITSEKNSFITNNSLILDYSDTTIPFSFVKYWALSTDFSPYVSGSAQPQITIDSLSTMNLTIPDEIILKKFNNIVIPILDKIFSNNAEIIRLSQLRDILLPRLLSGEINISDYIA